MTATASSWYPPELAVGVTSERIAQVSPAARTLHQAILRAFAAIGHAPDLAALAGTAPAVGPLDVLLAKLPEQDVVRRDAHRQIRAAYPFSATPTAHAVAIAAGATVYAMYSIDALGIAHVLRQDVTPTPAPATRSP
jgi:hypothetical protein